MARKPKSVLDGRFTMAPASMECPCGKPAYYMLKGNMRLLPNGHKCIYRDMQQAVVRTIRAEESAGIRVTKGEAERRINEVFWRKPNATEKD